MRRANTAIQRERHVTPTIDDMILDLNGSKVFSKLDLNAGYHQLNTISTALEGLQGVRNISDDIIVFGQNQKERVKKPRESFQAASGEKFNIE